MNKLPVRVYLYNAHRCCAPKGYIKGSLSSSEAPSGYSGGSRGGAPLFLEQTEARRAGNILFGGRAPPLSKALDDLDVGTLSSG